MPSCVLGRLLNCHDGLSAQRGGSLRDREGEGSQGPVINYGEGRGVQNEKIAGIILLPYLLETG